MLNKIDYFKGFGDYQEGVSRWSAETESYLFGVKETGVQNEEGQKEKEYYRYEYSRMLSPEVVEKEFVNAYMERAGYDLATQLKVSASSDDALKLEMERVMADAYFYAAGINHPGDRLEQVKRIKANEIQRYDQSEEVNQFTLVGKQMWLPKETRVGLVNSISIEKSAGKQNTVLWFDGVRYEIPIEQALKMLGALEMYALECYNVTHKHLSEVDKLLSVDAVAGYDHKAGYPEKLNFDSMEVKVCC